MNTNRYWIAVVQIAVLAQFGATATHAAPLGDPVAGLAPYQRPVSAPVLRDSPPLNIRQALHGVSSPIPDSLKFIGDQGGWFNPFVYPGMTGPYDLRGWHASSPSPAAGKK